MIGEHCTALTHGDVVRGVKAQGGNVTKGAHHLAAVGGAQSIAAVFNQPQFVFFANGGNHIQVKGVTQTVGKHDGLGFGADSSFNLAGIDVVGQWVHIHKHRYCTVLNDGVNCGWKSSRNANDFIAFLNGAVTQLGRCERAECDQVG